MTEPRLQDSNLTREWRVMQIYNGRGGMTGTNWIGPWSDEAYAREKLQESLRLYCDEAVLETRVVSRWEAVE